MRKETRLGRRTFLVAGASAGIAFPATGCSSGTTESALPSVGSGMSAPWKIDMTLYDRPGWCSHVWYQTQGGDGALVVPVQSCDMGKPFGDFLRTETNDVVLRSTDGGRSWTSLRDPALTSYPWGCYGLPGRTRDGTLVSVICEGYVRSAEERRAHLERHGIDRFYNSRSEWLYTPWPISMAEQLRNDGFLVHMPGSQSRDQGDGQMVFTLTGLVCRTSSNGGQTWDSRPIDGLPFLAKAAGSFRETLVTRSGTWIASISASPNPDRKPVTGSLRAGSYAVRSEDRGKTWQLREIAHDATGGRQFDETSLLELPSGRILAMIRHYEIEEDGLRGDDRHLYQSHSDDDGATWSRPVDTGIWGYPAHLLQLKSGKILCTYGHRTDPWGHRAVLSSDGGETWDTENTKILADYSLPGWTTYPMSSQLEDGTIFSTYGLLKKGPPGTMPERKLGGGKEGRFAYGAASLYSEDFVRPFG